MVRQVFQGQARALREGIRSSHKGETPMKRWGWVILVAGTALAVYVGFWFGFIGGIVTFFDAIKAVPTESIGVALGIAKFVFGPTLGIVIFAATVFIVQFFK